MEMNLSFEIDGKTIAEMVMKERLEMVNKRCKCIKSILELDLETKVDFMADSEGNVKFNIYANQYDYYSIDVNIYKFETMSEIRDFIRFMLENRIEELDFYKASIVEKVVIDMLEENECENLYVFDGKLCTDNQDYEWILEDIKEFHFYNDEDCLIEFYDICDECEYIVSFMNDEVQECN